VYYGRDIQPILTRNCAYSGCHDEGRHEAGVNLSSYDKVMLSAVVHEGEPDSSKMYLRITQTDVNKRMPLKPLPPLPPGDIALIRKWIEQGAQNLVCGVLCDTNNVTYTTHVSVLINANCIGCHNKPATGGGLILDGYSKVRAATENGALLCAVNHQPGCVAMPLGPPKLDACKLEMLNIWKRNGFPQ
jgi:hypothetical protein